MILNDEPGKQRILTALANQYSREILMATVHEPLSAAELSRKYEIPLNLVYPRLKELVEAGLIAVVKSGRTPDGKWYDLYRSLLLRVDVMFDGVDLKVDVKVNSHMRGAHAPDPK